jgi:hypothetical protein
VVAAEVRSLNYETARLKVDGCLMDYKVQYLTRITCSGHDMYVLGWDNGYETSYS